MATQEEMVTAGQKLIGILTNIRHETDYLPEFYYDWIDTVINQTEEIFTSEQEYE